MGDYLSFKKMITPLIIQVLFWLGVVLVVISGLITLTRNGGFLPGILTIVLGPLAVRIYAELLIVLFKIHETLNEIKDNTKQH